ncbi:hypothetical protein Fmac_021431 [Flemingia macrophylla]|uniref:Uncharacterized protein n=1 Tax=Flemingia macrophylla TaxID=520843 RepID=A0ABD1LWW6_9FABA
MTGGAQLVAEMCYKRLKRIFCTSRRLRVEGRHQQVLFVALLSQPSKINIQAKTASQLVLRLRNHAVNEDTHTILNLALRLRVNDLPQTHLAGTIKVSFDKKGAIASVPTPAPPKDAPYISNMAIHKSLQRGKIPKLTRHRGIGGFFKDFLCNFPKNILTSFSFSTRAVA